VILFLGNTFRLWIRRSIQPICTRCGLLI